MMRQKMAITVALLLIGPAQAQQRDVPASQPVEDIGEEIVVFGMTDGFVLDAKTLTRARETYQRYRQGLAPDAPFRFVADDLSVTHRQPARAYIKNRDTAKFADYAPTKQSATYGPLHIWIANADSREDVGIGNDGSLIFPASAYVKGAKILVNRPSSIFQISPEIMSPGTVAFRRRLGDLRLQCQVNWAILRGQTSAAIKTVFSLAGGVCKSRKLSYNGYTASPISSAMVLDGGTKTALRLFSNHYYQAPLADKTLSNEAVVALER
jgi:hypothetical protein